MLAPQHWPAGLHSRRGCWPAAVRCKRQAPLWMWRALRLPLNLALLWAAAGADWLVRTWVAASAGAAKSWVVWLKRSAPERSPGLLPMLRGPSAWVAPHCRHAEAAPGPEAEAAGSAGSADTAPQAAGATAAQEVQQAIEEGTQVSVVGWSNNVPCPVGLLKCGAQALLAVNVAHGGRAAPAINASLCCAAPLGRTVQAATEGLEVASSAAGAAVGGAAGVVASAADAARNITLQVVGGAAEVRRGWLRQSIGLRGASCRRALGWLAAGCGYTPQRVPAVQVSAPPLMRRLLRLCSAWCRRGRPLAKSGRWGLPVGGRASPGGSCVNCLAGGAAAVAWRPLQLAC